MQAWEAPKLLRYSVKKRISKKYESNKIFEITLENTQRLHIKIMCTEFRNSTKNTVINDVFFVRS